MAEELIAGLHCADVRELAAGFVLGALEPADADAVRAHLAACPEPHPEMAELGSVVPALLASVETVELPPSLKDRILAAAAADTQRERMPGTADAQHERMPMAAADTQRGGGGGLLANLFRRPVWAGVAMAAVVAAVALGAWNLALRSELDAYRNGVTAVLDAAATGDAQLAVLGAPDNPEGASGLAAFGGDGSIALVMRDLQPTAGAEVYEAWLIVDTGNPIPLGSFTVGQTGTGTFTTNHVPFVGATLALTREPGPGATTPTLPIIAAGAARSAT